MKDLLLILAGLLIVVSAIPYLLDIACYKTRPNIASWTTWTLLTGLATVAEIGAHEYRTAIFTGAATLETTLIVILGLKYGYVKYTRFDAVCQISAIIGIILWQIFNTPLIAVLASVVIDFIAVLPTYRHAWFKPYEETWQTFALSGVAGTFAIGALIAYNWVSLTFAVYVVIVNVVLSMTIILKRASTV